MKKTEPAGGCLGTLFALLVVLYVVFGMLWMFIKEHIGLIAVIAIIIGVLWYRNKMNKTKKRDIFDDIQDRLKDRFFGIELSSDPNVSNIIYIDLWSVWPYSNNAAEYIAYQKATSSNGTPCIRVLHISANNNMKLSDGSYGVRFDREFSLLYTLDGFKLDANEPSYLFAKLEASPNSTDYMFKNKNEGRIAEWSKDIPGYKLFFDAVEKQANNPEFIKYDKFNKEKYEEYKRQLEESRR